MSSTNLNQEKEEIGKACEIINSIQTNKKNDKNINQMNKSQIIQKINNICNSPDGLIGLIETLIIRYNRGNIENNIKIEKYMKNTIFKSRKVFGKLMKVEKEIDKKKREIGKHQECIRRLIHSIYTQKKLYDEIFSLINNSNKDN